MSRLSFLLVVFNALLLYGNSRELTVLLPTVSLQETISQEKTALFHEEFRDQLLLHKKRLVAEDSLTEFLKERSINSRHPIPSVRHPAFFQHFYASELVFAHLTECTFINPNLVRISGVLFLKNEENAPLRSVILDEEVKIPPSCDANETDRLRFAFHAILSSPLTLEQLLQPKGPSPVPDPSLATLASGDPRQ